MARADLASHQKKADSEQRTLIWVDESGFYLLPSVVRTYAPIGQTPRLRAPCSYERLSVISGITPAGNLLMQVCEHSLRGPQVVAFLKHLLRHLQGKLLVLWDGASIHRCQFVKEFLAQQSDDRLQVERLPSYAPELNPDEGIWRYLKQVELRNVVCHNHRELRYELRLATPRLRHKREVIKSCITHAGFVL